MAVWNGSAWVYQAIKNAQVDAAAAIAYSKLALTGAIVNADISTSAALAYSKLNLAAAIKDSDIAAAQNLTKLSGVTGTPDGTKFLRDDGTWSLPAGLTLQRKSAATVVNNTVTDTDLLNAEITIGANSMTTTKVAHLVASGDALHNDGTNAGYPRFKLKLGATTLIDTGASSASSSTATATRYPWFVEAWIQNLGAANSQWITFKLFVGTISGGNAPAYASWATGEAQTSGNSFGAVNAGAVDTTLSQALILSCVNATAATLQETKLYCALLEIL